jgi:hypothetical protein
MSRVFDMIETDNYDVPPDGKRAYFLKQLRELKGGVSEFVIHCSLTRPGEARPPHALRREADAQFFTSQEATDEIRRLGIKVVTWKELLRLQMAGKLP